MQKENPNFVALYDVQSDMEKAYFYNQGNPDEASFLEDTNNSHTGFSSKIWGLNKDIQLPQHY